MANSADPDQLASSEHIIARHSLKHLGNRLVSTPKWKIRLSASLSRDFHIHPFLVLPSYNVKRSQIVLTLVLLYPVLANSEDPDQLASEEANRSGSALYVML